MGKYSSKGIIALDGDGVLIDYHEGYAMGWERAFGHRPKIRNPNAYHPRHYWDVPELSAHERRHFAQNGMTSEVWASMPAMPDAAAACRLLCDLGFRLICVTALEGRHEKAREANLRDLGLPIDEVHAVGDLIARNPKVHVLEEIRPVAFVDDYLGYLQGLRSGIWRALITGRPHQNPNLEHSGSLVAADSTHPNLLDFATRAAPYLAG